VSRIEAGHRGLRGRQPRKQPCLPCASARGEVVHPPAPIGKPSRIECHDIFIAAHVPILCVDLIPLSAGDPARVGLIERATPGGGTGWCLVGGRVMRDEPLTSAIERHLHATLGNRIDVDPSTLRPFGVIEYFSEPGLGEFHDPRKHAVSVTYSGRCTGEARAQHDSEAISFRWYAPEQLPGVRYGFGQQKIIERFLGQNETACI
jgi:ADP-ribose pyrophosphatase YjhB (NUDIX family)